MVTVGPLVRWSDGWSVHSSVDEMMMYTECQSLRELATVGAAVVTVVELAAARVVQWRRWLYMAMDFVNWVHAAF